MGFHAVDGGTRTRNRRAIAVGGGEIPRIDGDAAGYVPSSFYGEAGAVLAAVNDAARRYRGGLRPSLILVANSGAQPDQAAICRAANREIRVFAERVSLCHSATLTRLTATAVMTCCKRVFANPI